jgi:hypothetical protein
VRRAELLTMGTCAARRRSRFGGERGSAFLLALTLVMVTTLLGIALFEISTIEAGLARSDLSDAQAFYCAEAQAARLYQLYDPANDPLATRGSQKVGPTTLALANGTYRFTAEIEVDPADQSVTVTATCALPNEHSRTVRRGGARRYSPFWHALVSGIPDPDNPAAGPAPDLFLGGHCPPWQSPPCGGTLVGGSEVIGGDFIKGSVYASGNVYLRGHAQVTGADPPGDQARITVAPGKSVIDDSSAFDSSAPGATAQALLNAFLTEPLTNARGTGVIDRIRAAVTNLDGTPRMKGTYQGVPVYHLAEIFRQLGATSEGNAERNLARPSGCEFGTPSADPKCQIWQDLVILGPRETCNPTCQAGVAGPRDVPSYFFMGLPRGASGAPQHTPFSVVFAAAVTASPELRQLGFTTNYASLGSTLDTWLGTDVNGEGRARRLVELTVGADQMTGQAMPRSQAPIFYVDGYWRVDGGTGAVAYNGRATVVTSKSMIVSDNLLYLGGLSNTNTSLPSDSDCAGGSGAASCGVGDMVGLVAKEDIWIGDPSGTLHEVSAVMLAGRDVNYFTYTSTGECCRGLRNPLSLNGVVIAARQVALVRDWADPSPGGEGATCNAAQSPCRPVIFVPGDTSCGAAGCWRFLTLDTPTGALSVDPSRPGFRDGCVTTNPVPLNLTPATCPPGTRRVTHFQLKVNYDERLHTAPGLTPPGLPTASAGQDYVRLAKVSWRDCGSDRKCR